MLDFYGYVVGHVGKLAVKFFDKLLCVTNAIKKVRVAERNVLSTRGDLLANVLNHNVATNDSKNAFVNGDDGAMAAKVFAAAARFRRAHKAESTAGFDKMSVLADGRHIRAVRDFEIEPFKRDERLWLWRSFGAVIVLQPFLQALSDLCEFALEFAAEDGGHAKRSQIIRVHRRVKAIAAQISERIQVAQGRDKFCSEPCGRVHRQIDGNQSRGANRRFIKELAGKIQAYKFVTTLAQPGCRRREPKGLAPQLVRRNQNDIHVFNSIAGRPP